MMDRMMLYDLIYALAARSGREATLFGSSTAGAREAFLRSLASEAFPELWFEVPLAGDPWFDLHALTARADVGPDTTFDPATCGGYPEAFTWFAAQESRVRQLALSWDVGSGDVTSPAVQLLLCQNYPDAMCGFLAAAGRSDAVPAFQSFVERLPEDWFACYAGVFPTRPGHNLRVECIPEHGLQQAYAHNPDLMEQHLRQTGLQNLGDTIVEYCQVFASTPFHLEYQFDVDETGTAGPTFSASLRFACPPGENGWEPFDINGPAGELMSQVEAWGLIDGRWRDLSGTMFAQRVSHNGESVMLFCYPAFLKLRWRDGEPLDAKAYLIAGVQ